MYKLTYVLKDISKHKQETLSPKGDIEIMHIVVIGEESTWQPKKNLLSYDITLIIEYIGRTLIENSILQIKVSHNSEINPRAPPSYCQHNFGMMKGQQKNHLSVKNIH